MRKLFKGISLLLVVILLMLTIPSNAIAEDYRNSFELPVDEEADMNTHQDEKPNEPEILGEIEEKREQDKKYFLRSDFTI